MRIFFALTTTAVLLSLVPIGNPQIQIKTEEHSCESHCNSSRLKPGFPVGRFVSRNSERDV
jgi:hypothetical protein